MNAPSCSVVCVCVCFGPTSSQRDTKRDDEAYHFKQREEADKIGERAIFEPTNNSSRRDAALFYYYKSTNGQRVVVVAMSCPVAGRWPD